MKTKLLSFAAAFAAAAAFADPNDPQITKIADATQGGNRVVVVNYRLDEPAIVTFDVKTNGVSIGAANLKYASGDVHKVVAAGDHVLNWNAWKAWPGYKFDDGSVSIEVKAWATNSPPDYMTVKLVGESPERPGALGEKRYYTGPGQLPDLSYGGVMEKGGVTNNAYKTDYLVMRRIPAAGKTFRMGAPTGEPGHDVRANEPVHYVALTNDFYMCVFEFTVGQFRNITTNFSDFAGSASSYNGTMLSYKASNWTLAGEDPANPIDCYSYQNFRGAKKLWPEDGHATSGFLGDSTLGKMRQALGESSLDFPTEAEWEFACRAGTTSGRYDGTEYNAADPAQDKIDFAKLGYIANDWSSRPQNVGLRTPNGYGLYDMYGNVAEWCLDRYAGIYATSGSYVIAPVGPDSGTGHTVRGAWSNYGGNTIFGRSAFRYEQDPRVGGSDTYYQWDETTQTATETELPDSDLKNQKANPRGYRLVCTF